jgi:hypothetical protein
LRKGDIVVMDDLSNGEKVLALKERVADALVNRPSFDQGEVDRAVDAAVAQARSAVASRTSGSHSRLILQRPYAETLETLGLVRP